MLVVVDAVVGATDTDEAVAKVLRRSRSPVILAANKVDDAARGGRCRRAVVAGPRRAVPGVRAARARGGDLLDAVLAALPEAAVGVRTSAGRPAPGRPPGQAQRRQVLAAEQAGRLGAGSVVDDVAGTTVDPVDELVELGGETWRFVDTAGVCASGIKEASGTEYYASLRTKTAIERAEVAVVLVDGSQPVTEQDLRIITMVAESGRALVIAFNKWDLVDEERRYYLDREIERDLVRGAWAPRVNISARTGWHVDRLVPALDAALEGWDKRITTGS